MNAISKDLEDAEFRARWLRRLVRSARRRGKEFNLSDHITEKLYQQQRGRCAVTGIRFSMERWEKALVKHPFAPSIDRRDSELGYTDENVRLVCVATNFGMGQWGEGVFLSLAHAAAELENQRRRGLDVLKGSTDAGSWYRRQQQRIEAAEKVRSLLSGEQRRALTRQIAGLKAALRKGPGGLKAAGGKAADTRRRLMRIREAALRIFTDALKAERWLNEPLGILGEVTPLEFARTEEGARVVENILGKIEWGAPA
jgi:uncharacterized protein (DUF2384 family)